MRMTAPKDPNKVLKETVEKTIDIVADHVEPGPRKAEETVEKVIETVDNDEVKNAIVASDEVHEAAKGAAEKTSFEEHERRMAQKNKDR